MRMASDSSSHVRPSSSQWAPAEALNEAVLRFQKQCTDQDQVPNRLLQRLLRMVSWAWPRIHGCCSTMRNGSRCFGSRRSNCRAQALSLAALMTGRCVVFIKSQADHRISVVFTRGSLKQSMWGKSLPVLLRSQKLKASKNMMTYMLAFPYSRYGRLPEQ